MSFGEGCSRIAWLLPPCTLLTALACTGPCQQAGTPYLLSSLGGPLQLGRSCHSTLLWASGRPAEPSLCCRYHMLKSGENVVMMDEIRSAEDVYGRLTDVVSTHAMLHWTLWLMPGARPEANVSCAGWSN